jgi:hypothetical protein
MPAIRVAHRGRANAKHASYQMRKTRTSLSAECPPSARRNPSSFLMGTIALPAGASPQPQGCPPCAQDAGAGAPMRTLIAEIHAKKAKHRARAYLVRLPCRFKTTRAPRFNCDDAARWLGLWGLGPTVACVSARAPRGPLVQYRHPRLQGQNEVAAIDSEQPNAASGRCS